MPAQITLWCIIPIVIVTESGKTVKAIRCHKVYTEWPESTFMSGKN